MITPFQPSRLAAAKTSFATRHVPASALAQLDTTPPGLRAGDVVLAKVTKIGQHTRIELPSGRRSALNVGDEIVIACGARYAPDQFHAVLPEQVGEANLVAGGGIAGIMTARHAKMKPATSIEILGRFVDRFATPINVAAYALAPIATAHRPPVLAVVGTSMNAGKTTTCASLIRGLAEAGVRPAYIKATGTGSGGDMWDVTDAGAHVTLDFTDAGYATTYHAEPTRLAERALDLVDHAGNRGSDVVVMEIADGLYQQETALLMASGALHKRLAGTVLAAVDSMGAVAATHWLQRHDHNILAVTGAFTQSPLAMQEFDRACEGITAIGTFGLADRAAGEKLLGALGVSVGSAAIRDMAA